MIEVIVRIMCEKEDENHSIALGIRYFFRLRSLQIGGGDHHHHQQQQVNEPVD